MGGAVVDAGAGGDDSRARRTDRGRAEGARRRPGAGIGRTPRAAARAGTGRAPGAGIGRTSGAGAGNGRAPGRGMRRIAGVPGPCGGAVRSLAAGST